jgi:NAD(P)-dependent dehydrogenase (short-subunit alcohol dehydrogenase family)
MLPLGEKVAVITGGMDARMAGVFVANGAKVVIAGRRQFPNGRVTGNPELSDLLIPIRDCRRSE